MTLPFWNPEASVRAMKRDWKPGELEKCIEQQEGEWPDEVEEADDE